MADKQMFYGSFKSDILWMLEPFVDYARALDDARFFKGSIFIEPANDGGAYIGALCTHAMLVVHDGDATCNQPSTLDIPYSMFRASAPTPPVELTYCGEDFPVAPPEWMTPGLCCVSTAGMFIQPKMRPPIFVEEDDEFWPALAAITASTGTHRVGVDYRASTGTPADWRKPLKEVATKPAGDVGTSFAANPEILGLFDRALKTAFDDAVAQDASEPPVMSFALAGPGAGMIVSISGRTDIIGCMMPMRQMETPNVPWHFLKPARYTEGQANG